MAGGGAGASLSARPCNDDVHVLFCVLQDVARLLHAQPAQTRPVHIDYLVIDLEPAVSTTFALSALQGYCGLTVRVMDALQERLHTQK